MKNKGWIIFATIVAIVLVIIFMVPSQQADHSPLVRFVDTKDSSVLIMRYDTTDLHRGTIATPRGFDEMTVENILPNPGTNTDTIIGHSPIGRPDTLVDQLPGYKRNDKIAGEGGSYDYLIVDTIIHAKH